MDGDTWLRPFRCWHRWDVLPDGTMPSRRVRRCRRCGHAQAQVTGFFWGTRWTFVPAHHWTDAVRFEAVREGLLPGVTHHA